MTERKDSDKLPKKSSDKDDSSLVKMPNKNIEEAEEAARKKAEEEELYAIYGGD